MVRKHRSIGLLVHGSIGLLVLGLVVCARLVSAADNPAVAVRVGGSPFFVSSKVWSSYPPGRPELQWGTEYISRQLDVPYPYNLNKAIDYFVVKGQVDTATQQAVIEYHEPGGTGGQMIYFTPNADGSDTLVDVGPKDVGYYELGILCKNAAVVDAWAYVVKAVLSDSTEIHYTAPDWNPNTPTEPPTEPPDLPAPPGPGTPPVNPTKPTLPDPGVTPNPPPLDPPGSFDPWPDTPLDPKPGDPGGPVIDPGPGEPGGPVIDNPFEPDPGPGEPGGPVTDPVPEPSPVLTPDPPPTADPVPAPDPVPAADPLLSPDPIPGVDPLPSTDPLPDTDPLPPTDPVPEVDPLTEPDPLPGGE